MRLTRTAPRPRAAARRAAAGRQRPRRRRRAACTTRPASRRLPASVDRRRPPGRDGRASACGARWPRAAPGPTCCGRRWASPAMLLAGALMGLAGVQLPAVEPMIAASLLVLGLLVVTRLRLPGPLAAARGRRVRGLPRRGARPGTGRRDRRRRWRWPAWCSPPCCCTPPASRIGWALRHARRLAAARRRRRGRAVRRRRCSAQAGLRRP